MTNEELEAIYKENIGNDHVTALRMVYNHGWYAGAGQTPTASSEDKSKSATKPTAIIKAARKVS